MKGLYRLRTAADNSNDVLAWERRWGRGNSGSWVPCNAVCGVQVYETFESVQTWGPRFMVIRYDFLEGIDV